MILAVSVGKYIYKYQFFTIKSNIFNKIVFFCYCLGLIYKIKVNPRISQRPYWYILEIQT